MSKNSHKSDVNVSYDILFSILIRISVKSLLRFRSISILWSDIISDREFKKAYINQSKALGRINFLLLNHINDEFKFINLKRNRLISIEGQRVPLKGYEYSRIVCSHDGLVLLQHDEDNYYKMFILWNPSTRQCVKLASCPYMNISTLSRGHEMSYDPQCYGLCYDPTTDDCKVILIYKSCYLVYSTRTFWTKKTTLPRATWLYLCEGITTSGCVYWSMLPSHGINSTIICFDVNINSWSSYLLEGITTGGCVYWYKVADDKRNSTIMYFDMMSHELKELPSPNYIGDDNDKKHLFRLTILKGHFCLYSRQEKNELKLNTWIMEDDGWKLLMKIPKVLPKYYRYAKILCCGENGEIIFQGPTNRHISIYNPKQGKEVVKQFIFNSNIGYSYLNLYPIGLDTLYFPKIMH
ncbi:hypothetical protein R3W88_025798 [Solanum pinnatisectum]|uniref:F-box associated beta-propeller type 3 domain-containing protein n=1 Tax=Solanum pinnatisectum TaxID=50273 RepID=A0AAV9M773_9SOLN|nr:hypothetical protein R3W88_025798 [Solanum pinnatisectum]